ncbi:hypothetical protein IC617_03285 [Neiella sp. HB171785]|uniref:Uncharacterized protein n=1 Tax=Neiella litorisoli TaxID=2771431 RepID=A0A8J6UF48_9GAMM|nr:hypothetical protein [Neiella litorisoli]MBD1388441.1 hypothetical protein [Neiella litorisoli]
MTQLKFLKPAFNDNHKTLKSQPIFPKIILKTPTNFFQSFEKPLPQHELAMRPSYKTAIAFDFQNYESLLPVSPSSARHNQSSQLALEQVWTPTEKTQMKQRASYEIS